MEARRSVLASRDGAGAEHADCRRWRWSKARQRPEMEVDYRVVSAIWGRSGGRGAGSTPSECKTVKTSVRQAT